MCLLTNNKRIKLMTNDYHMFKKTYSISLKHVGNNNFLKLIRT